MSFLLRLRVPAKSELQAFHAAQSQLGHSYPSVGATRALFPPGYDHDRNAVVLGRGEEVFRRAIESLKTWRMLPTWISIFPPEAPQVEGSTVVSIINVLGFYWINALRVVYQVDERSGSQRARVGFAYGTLPGHVESGEELFTVTWGLDDSVTFEISAFSRPRFWGARLAKPVVRFLQRRFVEDAKKRMLSAVA